MTQDPQTERIEFLAKQVQLGRATEAEREELAMYADESAAGQVALVSASQQSALGGNWLERATASEAMTAGERTPWTRAERKLGVALVTGGLLGALFVPAASIAAVLGGAILGASVLRVKILSRRDPYDDVEL